MRKYSLLYFLSALSVLLLMSSCPEPISEDLVAKVEDTGAPTIVISEPADNSIYRSTVSFSGKIEDDAANSIENIYFNVPNQLIGGGINISNGSVSKDVSAGDTDISYNPSNGNFSFTFSTIDPEVITVNRLLVSLNAVDWNGNEVNEVLTLYENEDGPYIELSGIDNDTVYDGSDINISGKVIDLEVPSGDPVSVENLKSIRWKLYSSPPQSYSINLPPEAPATGQTTVSATEYQNGTFYYNTETGVFQDVVKTINQTGSLDFEFTAEDLNEHVNKIEYTMSDGNYSPGMTLLSTVPPAYSDGKIYFSSSDTLSADYTVGPTEKYIESYTYNFITQSGSGAMSLVGTAETPLLSGLYTYTYQFSESASGFTLTSPNHPVSLSLTALNASQSSIGSIMYNLDSAAPSVERHNVASSAGIKNTYVDIELKDSGALDTDSDSDILPDKLWGQRYRASLLSASDLEIVKKTDNSEVIAISSVQEISDFDTPVPTTITDGTGTFRINISNKDLISARDGITEYTLRSKSSSVTNAAVALDKANNILEDYNFVFLDEAAPVVDLLTPANGDLVSLGTGSLTLKFSENNLTPLSGISVELYKNGSVTAINKTCTITGDILSIPFNDGDGIYSVVVPGGVIMDNSSNYFAGISAGNWIFTVDTSDPEILDGNPGTETDERVPANSSLINSNTPSISFKYSEDVFIGSGSHAGEVEVGGTYYSSSIFEDTVTVNLGAGNLSEGSNDVVIDANAFKDEAGNFCSAYSGEWSFTVDSVKPVVDSGSLTPGNNNFVNTVTPAISFDFTDTGNISDGSGTNAGRVKIGSTYYDTDISGKTITVDLDGASLAEGSNAVVIDANAFKDSADNYILAYSGSWSFKVDVTKPVVDSGSRSPVNGNITNDDTPTISFDFTDTGNILDGSGTNAGKVKIGSTYYDTDISGNTITVDLDGGSLTNGLNAVVIDANAFKDQAGNFMVSYSGAWSFTVDDAKPTVNSASRVPVDESETDDDSPSFSFNFDDLTNISAGSGTNAGKISIGGDYYPASISGKTISVDLSSFSLSDGQYNVEIDANAFKDEAGNYNDVYENIYWFRVDTKPYVVEDDQTNSPMSPVNGSRINTTTPTIRFYFDEAVSAGTGTNAGKVGINNGTTTTYYDTNLAGRRVTLVLGGATLPEGSYSVVIDADAFKDSDGTVEDKNNAYSGSWSFVVDTTAPTVNEPTVPASGSVINAAVDITVTFTLTESSNITEKSGGASVIFDCSGTDVTCTNVTVTNASNGTVQAVINANSLAEDVTYTLKVNAGEFVDDAGNGNTSKNSTWTITRNITL